MKKKSNRKKDLDNFYNKLIQARREIYDSGSDHGQFFRKDNQSFNNPIERISTVLPLSIEKDKDGKILYNKKGSIKLKIK